MNPKTIIGLAIIIGLVIGVCVSLPIALVTNRSNVKVQACTTIRSEALRAQCINPRPTPIDQCNSGAAAAGTYSQPFPWKQCIADLGGKS